MYATISIESIIENIFGLKQHLGEDKRKQLYFFVETQEY